VFGGKAGGGEDLLHEDGSAQSFEVDLAGCDELAEVSAEPWKEEMCKVIVLVIKVSSKL
jgi:hypothetical protein